MKHRLLRVNEVLKRELSGIITREMKFEAGLVTINQVDATSDLKNAHVFVSVLGTVGASVINQLEAHRAALQSAVAKHVVLKYTPHLVFHLDDSNERDAKFAEIGRALREHYKFAVLSHVRPDGDALGSTLALALSLKELGKDVRAWNEEGMLEKYSFLARAELLTKPPSTPEDFDVAIALDTAVQNRLGTALVAIRSSKIWINIDHHPSNPGYGDVTHIDSSAPATAEIVFHLIKSQGLPFNREIAENLYAAISTDTGSFQYPQTSARTFEIAAELIRTGLDVGRLSQQLYENYPRRRLELLRELLRTMRFQQEGRVASFGLTLKTAAELGVLPEDNEGLIDHLRAVRGDLVCRLLLEKKTLA